MTLAPSPGSSRTTGAIAAADITGVVLAGGRGSRMGGVDKGLQPHLGQPLARHALQRLAPQVGALMVNANRNLEAYAAMGVPVCADTLPGFAGPLAGLLAALAACRTPWLVTVPCDTPDFPPDLVERLAHAAEEAGADVAMAAAVEDGALRTQPVFCLLRTTLAASLEGFLRDGGRKVDRWTAQHRCTVVTFADAAAFFNANTAEELASLQHEQAAAEREREYSPSSCIGGDYRPYVEAYASRSAAARAEATALGGRWIEGRYGSSPAHRLDLCLPPGARSNEHGAGLLVFFHGGYWQELAAADSLFAAARCIERGIAFAAIDYTLAPQATPGAIVDECRAALGWLFAHAAAHDIDAANVVVAGSSAGAHLAAMVSLPPGAKRPRAAVLVSGIYRLEPLVGTSINAALGLEAAAAQALSPLLLPLRGFPPAIVCWGEIETAAFKSQSRDFAQALQDAGTPCDAFEVPARNHFDVILDLAEPGTLLGDRTLDLLDQRDAGCSASCVS